MTKSEVSKVDSARGAALGQARWSDYLAILDLVLSGKLAQ